MIIEEIKNNFYWPNFIEEMVEIYRLEIVLRQYFFLISLIEMPIVYLTMLVVNLI